MKKNKILADVEKEEEYLTNLLMKKLEKLQLEKIRIENQLEQEEENITNKLQAQLRQVLEEKEELEKLVVEKSPFEIQVSNLTHRFEKMVENEKVLNAKILALQKENEILQEKVNALEKDRV